MTTDGGGWTAVHAGRNGSVNVFDHFDAGAYDGICTDAATRCVRRPAPRLASTSMELAVACGGAMVSFRLTPATRSWLESGTQAGWAPVTPTVLEGLVSEVPNWIWTGSGGSLSFIFSRNQGAAANTFASTYDSVSYDYCNGAFDRESFVRVFLR